MYSFTKTFDNYHRLFNLTPYGEDSAQRAYFYTTLLRFSDWIHFKSNVALEKQSWFPFESYIFPPDNATVFDVYVRSFFVKEELLIEDYNMPNYIVIDRDNKNLNINWDSLENRLINLTSGYAMEALGNLNVIKRFTDTQSFLYQSNNFSTTQRDNQYIATCNWIDSIISYRDYTVNQPTNIQQLNVDLPVGNKIEMFYGNSPKFYSNETLNSQIIRVDNPFRMKINNIGLNQFQFIEHDSSVSNVEKVVNARATIKFLELSDLANTDLTLYSLGYNDTNLSMLLFDQYCRYVFEVRLIVNGQGN